MHALSDAVGSARLGMLQSLMETKKRAELLEQDFLNKMHAENAAFTQLAKSYDESLLSIQQDFAARLDSIAAETRSVSESNSETLTALAAFKSHVQTDMDARRGEFVAELDEMKRDLHDTSAVATSRMADFSEELKSQLSSVMQRLDTLETTVARIEQNPNLSGEISASVLARLLDLEARIAASEASQARESQAVQSRLQTSMESLDTRLMSTVDVQVNSLSESLSASLRALVDMQQTQDRHAGQLGASVKSLSATVADQQADLANHTQVYDLFTQYVDTYFSRFDAQLASLNTAGLSHFWQVRSTRGGEEFSQSDVFDLSQFYSNCFLRIFFSEAAGKLVVWFAWKPVGGGGNTPPILVDLSINAVKHCGIAATRKDQLHGCWVWETSFSDEFSHSSDLTIGVEVSLRQWLNDAHVQTALRAEQAVPQLPSEWTQFAQSETTTSNNKNPFDD